MTFHLFQDFQWNSRSAWNFYFTAVFIFKYINMCVFAYEYTNTYVCVYIYINIATQAKSKKF